MKIWHQSLTVMGDVPGYQDALTRHIEDIAGPEVEVVMHGLLPETYSTEYPLAELQHPALAYYHFNQLLSAGLAAEKEGFDAYAMCFLGGPLLKEIRTAIDIPVVNYGESAFHFAAFYGYRFGVIRFQESMNDFTQEFVTQWGFEKQFAGVGGVGLDYREIFSGFANTGDAIARIQERARKFIKDTGADVLVPGEMPLSVLLAVNGITRIDDVPILDGCALTILLAKMMVEMDQRFGMTHSRHGRKNAMPPKERLLQVAGMYGLDRLLAR